MPDLGLLLVGVMTGMERHSTGKLTTSSRKVVGSKTINGLPCYPLENYKAGDPEQSSLLRQLKSRLMDRGHMFVDLATAEKGRQMFSYSGKVLYRGIGISTIDSATQVTQV